MLIPEREREVAIYCHWTALKSDNSSLFRWLKRITEPINPRHPALHFPSLYSDRWGFIVLSFIKHLPTFRSSSMKPTHMPVSCCSISVTRPCQLRAKWSFSTRISCSEKLSMVSFTNVSQVIRGDYRQKQIDTAAVWGMNGERDEEMRPFEDLVNIFCRLCKEYIARFVCLLLLVSGKVMG